MKLILESRIHENALEVIESPKEDLISEEMGNDDFDFAILEGYDELNYIQCRKLEESDLYILEYQDGSVERHYQVEKPVSYARAVSAFIWYLRGDLSWHSEFDWERIAV